MRPLPDEPEQPVQPGMAHVGEAGAIDPQAAYASDRVPYWPPKRDWPVCLPCWRQRGHMRDDPPREPGWPEHTCTLCGRRANHGILLTREELDALSDVRPV